MNSLSKIKCSPGDCLFSSQKYTCRCKIPDAAWIVTKCTGKFCNTPIMVDQLHCIACHSSFKYSGTEKDKTLQIGKHCSGAKHKRQIHLVLEELVPWSYDDNCIEGLSGYYKFQNSDDRKAIIMGMKSKQTKVKVHFFIFHYFRFICLPSQSS